jgi:hypothetical protein
MLYKLLLSIVLIGVGIKFLASIAAHNARKKQLKAQQAGRPHESYADRGAFWRKVDRICIVMIGAAAVWYVIGVALWLFSPS